LLLFLFIVKGSTGIMAAGLVMFAAVTAYQWRKFQTRQTAIVG
jgi:hypothetical protein